MSCLCGPGPPFFIATELTMIRIANRIQDALTFQAMEVTKTAQKLKEQGKDIISLGIGEPDFTAPPIVVETLSHAAEAGLSGYSPALGIAPLRTAIADYYKNAFGASVNPEQVIITSGASGALSLACLSVLNPGDEILMPDPAYPANSNFIICAGAKPRLIPCLPTGEAIPGVCLLPHPATPPGHLLTLKSCVKFSR